MRTPRIVHLLVCLLILAFSATMAGAAPAPRLDTIWARATPGPITLNGVLSEPAWAQAESMIVRYDVNSGDPGGGWKVEAGFTPTDPTYAVLKFLVSGNQLYLAAKVKDKSIGGSIDFNRFDGLLMCLKDHADPGHPKPPNEYLYGWWYGGAGKTDPRPLGEMPMFRGKYGVNHPDSVRSAAKIAAWDAVTVVQGVTNSDAAGNLDTGYTVEMRFDLGVQGYDVTKPLGDVLEWNVSIYDCDYAWPITFGLFSANRVWWQSPWGFDIWYHEVEIHARPDVTVSSGALPTVGPDMIIPEMGPPPVIDGRLYDAIWQNPAVPKIDIRYNDNALRDTYPGVGPYRSGQHMVAIYGGTPVVSDPANATVRVFYNGDKLYLGFDVRDKVVQYHANFDRWDGFITLITDRVERNPEDHQLLGRRISFQVAQDGTALPQDYLLSLITNGWAQVALRLKGGTTVDTLGASADSGYTAELCIDLKGLGYPHGLGDHVLFFGLNLLDADSFNPTSKDYGTRTWWFKQYENDCCIAWTHLGPLGVVDAEETMPTRPGYALLGSFPNPSARSVIRYRLGEASQVTLEVFDIAGRLTEKRPLGLLEAGDREVAFDGSRLSSGIYFYRLLAEDPTTRSLRTTLEGRMTIVK